MLPRTLYESLTKKTMAALSLKLMMIPFQTNKVQANNEYDLHHRLFNWLKSVYHKAWKG